MTASDTGFEALQARLRAFTAERGWARFHSPKNLVMALTGETGELAEQFQWLSEEESRALTPEQHEAVRRELADIQIYLLMLADKLGVELQDAVNDKIDENENKYPADQARGRADKYNKL